MNAQQVEHIPSRVQLEHSSQAQRVCRVLREYFALEFANDALPFAFDIERIVDDFIMFCMLVGNDFLPHSPTLDIAEGALTHMFEVYQRLLPSLGGYITNAGRLDHARLETFLQELALTEMQTLQERAKVRYLLRLVLPFCVWLRLHA